MFRLRIFLILTVLVVATTAFLTLSKSTPTKGIKTSESHWAETGLGEYVIEDLLETESCNGSQRYFLSCMNAIGAVALRLGLHLDEGGEWHLGASSSWHTEKSFLTPWIPVFEKMQSERRGIDFVRAWRELSRKHMDRSNISYYTGIAINAFLSVFRDPHTYLIPISYYQDVVARKTTSSSALGLVFSRSQDKYYLRKVLEGSPSFKAGLKKGDWVTSINGVSLTSASPQRVSEILRKERGTILRFAVLRSGREQIIDVRRENVDYPSVTWKRIDGIRPVGVITINKFGRESCGEVKRALNEMNEVGMKGLLIDLRDNGGGHMGEAACMLSLFAGPDRIAFRLRYLDPSQEPEDFRGKEERVWFGKTAVLINAGSASASEILAGGLRDYGLAVLVGEKSFGKGSFQEGEIWGRNKKILLFQTRGFYYLPSGFSPQLNGILPDVHVSYRDGINLREADQYMNPLNSPQITESLSAPIYSMRDCLRSEEIRLEDSQMETAHTALFCHARVAHGFKE